MSNLQVINQDGVYVIDSRDVATMTGKQHKDLLETIRGYEQFLTGGEFRSLDFFIPGTYVDSKGETRPNYLLTRKGCDMVANKMTGEKGVLFTAAYVTKFEEMEKELNSPNYPQSIPPWHSSAIGEIRFAKEFAIAAGIRTERVLAVALARIEKETGKQLGDYRKTLPAPKEEDAEILNSGQIGERLIPPLKASNVNLALEKMGFQQGLREPGKVPGTERLIKHNPWRLTDKGKEYGMMQDSAKQQGANKWEGFQIMWSSKTVDAVRDFLDRKSENHDQS